MEDFIGEHITEQGERELYLPNQGLTTLDGYDLTDVVTLHVEINKLTVLPKLSNKLKYLDCGGNKLTVLPNLSSCPDLEFLSCGINKLTALPDLSKCIKLKYLYCGSNRLTSLPNLSSLVLLNALTCSDNLLTTLPNLDKCLDLDTLICSNNQLVSLPNLFQCTKLKILQCDNNPDLKTLPRLPEALASLDCDEELLDKTYLPFYLVDINDRDANIFLLAQHNKERAALEIYNPPRKTMPDKEEWDRVHTQYLFQPGGHGFKEAEESFYTNLAARDVVDLELRSDSMESATSGMSSRASSLQSVKSRANSSRAGSMESVKSTSGRIGSGKKYIPTPAYLSRTAGRFGLMNPSTLATQDIGEYNQITKHEVERVFENNDMYILKPLTKRAFEFYSQGTNWLEEGLFRDDDLEHLDTDPLYIIFITTVKYLLDPLDGIDIYGSDSSNKRQVVEHYYPSIFDWDVYRDAIQPEIDRETEKVFENSVMYVLKPLTGRAFKFYSNETAWQTIDAYGSYDSGDLKLSPIYIIFIKDTTEKYLFDPTDGGTILDTDMRNSTLQVEGNISINNWPLYKEIRKNWNERKSKIQRRLFADDE